MKNKSKFLSFITALFLTASIFSVNSCSSNEAEEINNQTNQEIINNSNKSPFRFNNKKYELIAINGKVIKNNLKASTLTFNNQGHLKLDLTCRIILSTDLSIIYNSHIATSGTIKINNSISTLRACPKILNYDVVILTKFFTKDTVNFTLNQFGNSQLLKIFNKKNNLLFKSVTNK